MPVRSDAWPAGTPCWVDLSVPDLEAAKRFYAAVLGWEFVDFGDEFGGYVNCHRGGATVAGLSPQYQPGMPVAWTTYFATDDAAATAAKVGRAGGKMLFEPMDLMGLGSMALAADPGGATFGLWQSGRHTGSDLYREPGAVVWENLVPGDGGAAAAAEFYGSVLDLRFTPTDGGYTFTVADPIDEEQMGSIGAAEAETAAPHWQLWFIVADTDAAAAAAGANGGKVVGVPEDTPFGRQARLLDPAGAELFIGS